MTLVQLRYALAVAGCRSFSQAASGLFITQPALSNALKELEGELGIRIFRRSSHGIEITRQGEEFLGYARNIVTQSDMLLDRYTGSEKTSVRFVVSSQHYSFAVSAFIRLVRTFGMDIYDFCLRETRTREIISDVHNLAADIGVIYLSDHNRRYMTRLLREEELEFTGLASYSPHVFISRSNPLAEKSVVTLEELKTLPFICFEQGRYENDFMAEELIADGEGTRVIRVSDRATLFNLLLGLNGYTIASGVISPELNPEIASVRLEADGDMEIGVIRHRSAVPGPLYHRYVEYLKQELGDGGTGVSDIRE